MSFVAHSVRAIFALSGDCACVNVANNNRNNNANLQQAGD